jgi:hypothetical protein
MKTVLMWSFENGTREINIHDVEPEIFGKLKPVLDVDVGLDHVGRINVDKNTVIIFYKKQDGKDGNNECTVENAETEQPVC